MDGTRKFQVVRVQRKLPTKKPPQPEPEPVVVTRVDFSGSLNECVRLHFSANLSAKQRAVVENAVKSQECYEYVREIRWPDNKTFVVEVWRKSLCECSRYDIEKVVRGFIIPPDSH